MSNPLMIGVCGGSWGDGGVGKTTVVNILSKKLDFHPVSFIDPIKDIARKFFGWNGEMNSESRILLDGICRTGRQISEDYWMNLALSRIPKNAVEPVKIVFDDLFFSNEVKMIISCGGLVVRVTKNGHETPVMPCETLDISNDGSLMDLQTRVLLQVETAFSER